MAEDFFTDFELVPPSNDDFSLDDELSVAETPFDDVEEDTEDEAIPIGTTWRINYETGQFDTFPLRVTGSEAITIWIETAMRTRRGDYLIFTEAYGRDTVEEYEGHYHTAARDAIIFEDIHRTLTAHDRITDVTNPIFYTDPDDEQVLMFNANVEVDGGTDSISLQGVAV